MPPRFEPGYLLFYKDIERCPYVYWTNEAIEWSRKRDKEEMLIALERYLMILDYLRKVK